MDGVWRGPSWTILPSGEKHVGTQTERIGPFLDGSVKVIEFTLAGQKLMALQAGPLDPFNHAVSFLGGSSSVGTMRVFAPATCAHFSRARTRC